MAIEMIRLNLIPEGKMPVVHCKQYDVDRSFKVCVYEGDKPYIFTDETVELNVRKSDTTLVTTDLDVTSGVHCLVVHTTEQMCAVTGKNECEIRVIKEGANIGSLNFIMEIKRSPTEGGLRSDSEINNLQRQMEDIIDPILDEKVPPIVEELVPQVIGEDYYNKTEINTIVEGIDTALEGIGHDIDGINDDIDNLETALGSKADTTYVDTELAKKADKSTTYTKAQSDGKFATISTTYTKTQSDSRYPAKTDVYTKTQADGRFPLKNDVYTKIQSDVRFALISNTYTKAQVDAKIAALPEAMIFKGTLGVNGDIQALPTPSASNEGWTFKCITAGTYSGLTLKVGDTVTCFNPPNTSVYEWDISGYGDTDTDTWRAIKVNGEDALGSGISSGSVDFVGSENIDVEFDSNGNKIGVKTKNIYTKTEVDDIVYNILPDDTASGSVANFNTSLELPIKSLEIDVNAKQDLHGYDYPWTAGGGKNKCSMPNQTFEQFAEIEIDEIPAGSYAYSAVITSTDTDSDKCAIIFLDAEKNTLTSKSLNRSVGTSRISTTFTVSSPIKYLRLYAASGFPSGAGDTASFVDNMICLQSASNPTAFEPYENICPIEGWSEISLAKCGKNLLNVLPLIDDNYYSLNSDGSLKVLQSDNRGWNNVSVITRLKKGTYTLSRSLASGYCDVRTSLNNYSSGIIMGLSQTSKTFTLSDDANIKVKFGYGLQSGYPFDCFFNISVGSSATTYEPFNGNTEVIELGGTYYGGHFTQDKAGHRQFEVTHNIIDLGNLVWAHYTISPSYWFSNDLINTIKKTTVNTQIADITCECSPKASSYSIASGSTTIGIAIHTSGAIRLVYPDMPTTVEDLIADISGNKFVYPIAEPYTIDLPDGEPITTLIGTNNIYADTGDTEVVFKDSVNGYVEKKIASVQALALNT